jgi:BirA family biotin operon repressor/biotin-[acetyl-CoA-carboxylase] ligase
MNNGKEKLSEKIRECFKSESLKSIKIFEYDITDSTNTRSRCYAEENQISCPCIFVAERQTAGRGRRGKSFDSSDGAGLYISFLLPSEQGDESYDMLTVHAAVAVHRTLSELCGIEPQIKWVNDIVLGGKKLAGILAEGVIDPASGRIAFAICGIGINLKKRSFPPELENIATTVEECGGALPKREAFIARLTEHLILGNRENDIDYYRKHSAVIGKTVTVKPLGAESYIAKAVGITDSGALSIICANGEKKELISAEISIKL